MLIMKVKSYQINKVQMLTACNGSVLVYNSCIVYLTYYRYKLLNKKPMFRNVPNFLDVTYRGSGGSVFI